MTTASSASPIARVIFINRFYRPDETATAQLLTDLAENLAARNFAVTVIAGHPGGSVARSEVLGGVQVFRVRGTRRRGARLWGKAVDFASFYLGAMIQLWRITRRDDELVALTDPPLLGIGVSLVAKYRKARLFHWVQDVYPELAIELAGQRWLRHFLKRRNAAWRNATYCVAIGRDMIRVLHAAGVPPEKIVMIPNWAPTALMPPTNGDHELRTTWDLEGKFVVMYSGNFGRVHDLMPILSVAEALREETGIAFVFVGDGAQRRALERQTAARDLPNVFFRPPQPRAKLNQSLGLADVHLVTLRPGCEELVFPSKIYGIAAVGRPVFFLGPLRCEIAHTVTERRFGRAFEASDTSGIVAAVRSLMDDPESRMQFGRAALVFSENTGGFEAAIDCWELLLTPADKLADPLVQR